jgi:fatty-acyl-CoA synthase
MTDATMMHYPLTTNHIVKRAAKLFPHVEIVSQMPDKSLKRHDYASVYARSKSLAKALIEAGLKPGERVATLMWNHHAHLEAYYGVPMAGGVYHTLNLRLSPADIAYIANHAEDRFLIVDDTLLKLLAQFKDQVNFEKIFVVAMTGAAVPEGFEDYEALLASAGDVAGWEPPERGEEDAAGMCYTSGTTGRPKGVIYSHRAIVLHSFASALVDTLALSQKDTLLPVVPMFHANAWGLPFTAALVGTKQVHPGPYLDPPSLLDLYVKERVTVSAGVPTIWIGIQQSIEREPDRWDYVKPMRMIVGGSAAPESMIRTMDTLGMEVIHAWGMTETAPLGTVATVKGSLMSASEDVRYAVRAKQGYPVPFFDVRAVNSDGEVAWDGVSMGELQVRGPWVASSYYANPDAEDRWTADGWFCTGDVVTIDAHGYVQITDRTKDLIKSGGEWISSIELENTLMGHPSVLEAAVIAVPHPKWVERPLAVVVPRPGQTIDAQALEAFLAQKFNKIWLPDGYVVRDAIPRTSAGKILKSQLRDELQNYHNA